MRSRLERLLGVYGREVDAARLALASALVRERATRAGVEGAIRSAEEAASSAPDFSEGHRFNPGDMSLLAVRGPRVESLRKKAAIALSGYAGALRETRTARAGCLSSERKMKPVERLCGIRRAVIVKETERREEAEADDIQRCGGF